ncbi:MAG: glycosyltransferase family 39 protein [Deltaproteobacteria bacterium]|nr:glycosyltransferase family 39 protein [Deltaproteobacteria bacterium]
MSATERRISWGLLALAWLWFTLAACWELFGPLLAGHYAASASLGIAADNMLEWGIIGPVWSYAAHQPPPSHYYCHHPWGIFWTTTVAMKIFGHHDFVCRLPAVLLSSATPPLLFLLGRAIWRPAAGAACAAAFVVLPITLAFANFNALEVPVIAWSTLGLWAYVRHNQTWKRRYLVASLCGFAMALHADWPAYVLVSALLCFGLLHGIVFRRALGRVRLRPYVRWWALTAMLTAATLGLYLYLFHRSSGLADLFASYTKRSAGSGLTLSKVLDSRRYWIEVSFTPIAILIGKVAAGLSLVRLLWRRDPHEVVPLLVLFMAVVQYVGFKQGADVHIYWPHYFAAFFALGMGALTATGMGIVAPGGRDTRGHPAGWRRRPALRARHRRTVQRKGPPHPLGWGQDGLAALARAPASAARPGGHARRHEDHLVPRLEPGRARGQGIPGRAQPGSGRRDLPGRSALPL